MADNQHLVAVLFVVAIWWLSTALVLRLVWLGPDARRPTLLASAALGLVGFVAVAITSRMEGIGAAYLGFGGALLTWAHHELAFLLGAVTGPRKQPETPGIRGLPRFREATSAVIHHEVALALTAVAFVAVTWGTPNPAGTGTFLVLWVMRLSAKFNVFLGVRNISEDFVPDHLAYLVSYFRRRRWSNPLMVASLLLGGAATTGLVGLAAAPGTPPHLAVAWTLVATTLGLAWLEHVFLALPLPDALLWRWVLPGGDADRDDGGERSTPPGLPPNLREALGTSGPGSLRDDG
jgi:putative photosynthetic complex assembly protein 2